MHYAWGFWLSKNKQEMRNVSGFVCLLNTVEIKAQSGVAIVLFAFKNVFVEVLSQNQWYNYLIISIEGKLDIHRIWAQ